ncbi:hypothetical protein J2S19_002767 [Metabacillus malikii]|uniref:Uncharacterized protein n=1 Tax=Metabacillus malikii TaxID=1504265 RepID=A0ABT9ZHV8_9BACI|nr:hypothetical protein [Metabacillus malikii]
MEVPFYYKQNLAMIDSFTPIVLLEMQQIGDDMFLEIINTSQPFKPSTINIILAHSYRKDVELFGESRN